MTAPLAYVPISIEDYLSGEPLSGVKHDYVDGQLFRVPEEDSTHKRIAANSIGLLDRRLADNGYRCFDIETRIRILYPLHTRFYHPDVSVVAQDRIETEAYQDQPVLLLEVLSEATRRTDHAEKLEAYLMVPSLVAYVLLEPQTPAAVVYRRKADGSGFEREVYVGLEAGIPLPELETDLPLSCVYARDCDRG